MTEHEEYERKAISIGIIGTGWVGSSVAISVLQTGIASELLLHDARGEVAEGEAMDLAHGAAFYPTARVRTSSVEAMADADAVVVTAGRGGGPEESRLDLLRDNARIIADIGRKLSRSRGIVVVVTNPVDILTNVMTQASGLPPARVIGTGTMLDTARLRQVLGRELHLAPRSIHAQIVGEHGDSEVVLWSGARVGGMPLREWPGWDRSREEEIAEEVRHAAYEIIRRKGATNHAIGLVTASLLRWALRGDQRIMTVSRVQDDAMPEIEGVALSLPTVVGVEGATRVLQPAMTTHERQAFRRSASLLREAMEELESEDDWR